MQIQVAVAKVPQYAVSESGDTLEMIERPQGGLSLVLADGQRSGHAAKSISTLVTSKATPCCGGRARWRCRTCHA